MKKIFFLLILMIIICSIAETKDLFKVGRVQYDGGGDWYNNPSVIPNLCEELRERTRIDAVEEQVIVTFKDNEMLNYPFLYLTGHGNIVLSKDEVSNLQNYLRKGGFLYIDDDYGLDESIRRELKKIYPEKQLQELPSSFPLFDCFYNFPQGLPKIHKHDGKRPQAFGIFDDYGRLTILYTYETNISDGWASPNVHKDPPEIREKAFKMGINIVYYVLNY